MGAAHPQLCPAPAVPHFPAHCSSQCPWLPHGSNPHKSLIALPGPGSHQWCVVSRQSSARCCSCIPHLPLLHAAVCPSRQSSSRCCSCIPHLCLLPCPCCSSPSPSTLQLNSQERERHTAGQDISKRCLVELPITAAGSVCRELKSREGSLSSST